MTHDTLSVAHIQYDSIYICKEITYEPLDTATAKLSPVKVRESLTEYRYKHLRDTLHVVRIDSIPYEVRVVETKEIRYIPPWLKLLSWIGAIASIILFLRFITIFPSRH